jgi:hypothetical protein
MLESRIIEVFNYSDLSRIEFANKVGISNAVMSHINSGRNKASTDLIITILKNFEDISPDWLLFGHGEMLRSQKGQFIEIIKNDTLDRLNKIKEVQKELENLIADFQEYLEAVK